MKEAIETSAKLQNALNRLNCILPLQESQSKCNAQVKMLHQQLLHSFVQHGRILSNAESAVFVDDVAEAFNVLHKYDLITLSHDGEPVGIYPFTMHGRGHTVHVNGHRVQAMCALDALAIGPMFQESTQISSQCRVTAAPIAIEMTGQTIQNLAEVGNIHIGIGWTAANASSCCADSLCMEMIFLRDNRTAEQWLTDQSEGREIFTLQEAVQLASMFFLPLLS
ncbi:MAG: organomercurial lyase [Caldilineaceae bacterium]